MWLIVAAQAREGSCHISVQTLSSEIENYVTGMASLCERNRQADRPVFP